MAQSLHPRRLERLLQARCHLDSHRLHSLLGDYYQAIKVLENIELNKKSLYSRVPGCQITTYYYVG